MPFPYERYETLAEPLTVYYPPGEEPRARQAFQAIDKASHLLEQLLGRSRPELEILLVSIADWSTAPHDQTEEPGPHLPYWTSATTPPCIVIPTQLAPIVGDPTPAKQNMLLYHQLAYAFLESDPRPWPDDPPLWADEWQFSFAALWLSHRLDAQQGAVMKDLEAQYAEIFVPEEDGKTPATIRGFNWDEDTPEEDYLCFDLLLERLAADVLARYDAEVLPRFLTSYRRERAILLSDDVTSMLGNALGPAGVEWLENLAYF
ncbi:MAG: hypothetical protein M3Y81_17360 [Chloroflexota bacterium]|nr:hypothetical protein [Chloroflexota bacterium]